MKPFFASFLLLITTSSFAQHDFSKVDAWMDANVEKMGGRAYLMVYKDGKIVYSHAENELSRRQKLVGKFLAKRQARTQIRMITPLPPNSRWPVAANGSALHW
jgi:hypothetical protein